MNKFENDLEIFNEAMHNAYLLITHRVTMDNLYESLDKGLGHLALPFDPSTHDGRSEDIIDMLVEHFIESEEYEKCAELLNIKKKIADKL